MARKYIKKTKGRKRRMARPWYTKKYSTQELALKAWSGIKYLKGLVNSEMFKNDSNWTSTATSNTGVIGDNFVAIAQGDGISGRTGNSILVRSVAVNLTFTYNSTTPGLIRYMIFIDNQQISDTLPVVTDVLETASPTSYLNKNNVGRFSILYDHRMYSDTQHPVQRINKFFKLQHHVRFNGPLSTDIQKGTIYFLLLSDVNGLANWYGDARCSYHDN